MHFEAIPASEEDLPVIVSILNEAQRFKIEHGDLDWGTDAFTEESIVKYSNNNRCLFIVKDDNQPVGTFSLQWEDSVIWGESTPAGYLHRLAVGQGHHSKGLGSRILALVEEEVSRRGYDRTRFDCAADNIKLCAYYEQQGYSKVGNRSIKSGTINYSAALFEKISATDQK